MTLNVNRLVKLYKSKLLTQEDLADISGVSKQSISSIINEKSDPQLSTIEKLALALEVPITYFFEHDDSISKNNINSSGDNVAIHSNNGNNRNFNNNNSNLDHETALLHKEIEMNQYIIDSLKAQLKDKEEIILLLKGKKK